MRNILIVDDSRTARMITRKCLTITVPEEVRYIEAKDGQDALTILEAQPADLVVTDLNMPVMDGRQLLKAMAGFASMDEVPVLVITSGDNPALSHELSATGALAVLSKPLSPAKLTDVLQPIFEAWGMTYGYS